MSLADLQKLYNRRAIVSHKRQQMQVKRAKRKQDRANHRHQMHRKKWQDRKDKKSNQLVSLRFVDKNFMINV